MSDHEHFSNPLNLFDLWLKEARVSEEIYPEAMCLSTVSNLGRPSSRIVLMKDFSENGVTFYTNTESEKGKEIKDNPWVALTFYWKSTKKQVRIEGKASSVENAAADQYFQERLLESKISAWASKQSEQLSSQEELEARMEAYSKKFKDGIVPRPPHWSGYCVEIESIEFWKERPFRLHERTFYKRVKGEWVVEMLYP